MRAPAARPPAVQWTVGKQPFLADAERIVVGDEQVATADVEVIRLVHVVENPTGATLQRYTARLTAGPSTVKWQWQVPGRDRAFPPWTGVLAILEAHVVPRLVQGLVDRMWRGEEVEVGGLTASTAGLTGRAGMRKVHVPWASITDIRARGPYLEVHGASRLKVADGADNRILVPALARVMCSVGRR